MAYGLVGPFLRIGLEFDLIGPGAFRLMMSADAIPRGYQVRYQQLRKELAQRKLTPEPKTPKVTPPANNKSKSDDQKERDPTGPTLLNFMPVSTMLAIVLIVIFGIMYVLN